MSSPWSVRAALLRPRPQRFDATQLLDPGHQVSNRVAPFSAAITPSGTATVAWSALGAAGAKPHPDYGRCYPCPVLVATSERGGRFGQATTIARNGAALGIVAARDETAVLWVCSRAPTSDGRLRGRSRDRLRTGATCRRLYGGEDA